MPTDLRHGPVSLVSCRPDQEGSRRCRASVGPSGRQTSFDASRLRCVRCAIAATKFSLSLAKCSVYERAIFQGCSRRT